MSIRPQGDNASYILNSLSAEGLSLAALTVSLAQAVLNCTNEQKHTVLRAATTELTGQAGVFHFMNQLQSAILISQSQQDLNVNEQNIFLLFLKTLQCLWLSTFGRKTNGGFGCLKCRSILAPLPCPLSQH